MSKKATVNTNDPENSRVYLVMSGEVEAFAYINPKYVRLNGTVGETIETTVRIKPKEKYPFKILETGARRGGYIDYKLEEVQEEGKTVYNLKIRNKKTEAGGYSDTIYLTTDSKIKEKIPIRVWGRIIEKKAPAKKG